MKQMQSSQDWESLLRSSDIKEVNLVKASESLWHGNQDLPSQTALLVDFEATNQFVVVRTERSLLFASTFDCSGSGVGRGDEGVLQWWLEEGGESPVCPSRNYPISLSLSLDTARQYRQYMVTYKSVLNCMVISWTARKPTLYLLHGLVLSWTHCKPTVHTAPAISRAPILSLPPILQGPRNSNWSPITLNTVWCHCTR